MSEDQEKPTEEQAAPEPKGLRGGERLAEARREQQISVVEVAKELHLDEHKVRALERNDFEVLGAPVFAKGHLRKYAQLVGVAEDDLFNEYYQLTRQEIAPPIVIGRRRSTQELSPGPWIAVIIVIIVAAASYWWFAVYSAGSEAPATSPEEAPLQDQSQVTSAPVNIAAGVVTAEPEPEPVVSQPQPEAAPALPDGEVRLTLSYSGDCWTEISDATGQRLFFDMGRTGNTVELTGTPPFAVLFGNIDNVAVSVDGRDYPISSNNPGSRTARLSIVSQ